MPAIMTKEEAQLLSRVTFDKLSSRDPVLEKQAEATVTAFTRTKMREDGFMRRIMPIQDVVNSDLVRQLDTDKPVMIIDREPGSPAAISVGYGTRPDTLYIHGDRYPVYFDRIFTPRFAKDVSELRTWEMDIRQVLSDNAIKDMLAEEDGKWLRAINTALVGPGLVVPTSGVIQYERLSGGIDRDGFYESMKVMPNTPSNLEVHTILLNNITIKEVCKWTRNETGGDMAQDILKDGWSLQRINDQDLIVTIKKGLVATNTFYHFARPNFIGKFYSLENVTLAIRREDFMIDFFAYEEIGAAIGWTSGLARIDFV